MLLTLFTDAACAQVLAEGGITESAVRERLTQRARTPVHIALGVSPDPALPQAVYDPARQPNSSGC